MRSRCGETRIFTKNARRKTTRAVVCEVFVQCSRKKTEPSFSMPLALKWVAGADNVAFIIGDVKGSATRITGFHGCCRVLVREWP